MSDHGSYLAPLDRTEPPGCPHCERLHRGPCSVGAAFSADEEAAIDAGHREALRHQHVEVDRRLEARR